jgi:hypothetical protein
MIVALAPAPAYACPACLSASDPRVLLTYLLTGGLMTVLPLGIVTVFGVWLRSRGRAAGRSSEAQSSQA